MPKTMVFSTSIFWGFGLHLGASWASKMEPSWPKRLGKTLKQALLDRLKLKVFQKWCLGGLRAGFWRPRTRFWRPRNSIWEGSGTIFSRFLARMPRKPRTPRTPAKTRPRSQIRQRWVAGGGPPRGVSIRRPPKVCHRRAELVSNSLSDTS